MNFSGKHFEFAGTSSKDPLGDGSVSLIFAHIDTEMFKQPFGYPEYSSVYSGRLGRRGLTGTKRNDSCLEIDAEIVSEKSGIPLASLRVVEQWLFSREAFAKLYIAEDEEDEVDVQYINGEKKRLYLNCMLTEPEILTYAEGKVGWKVKIICDAPWAWQDEHTQTVYSGTVGNQSGWYYPVGLDGQPLDPENTYYVPVGEPPMLVEAGNFTIPQNLPQRETDVDPYMDVTYGSAEHTVASSFTIPAGATVSLYVAAAVNSPGYAFIEIDGVEVAATYGGGEVEYIMTVADGVRYTVTSAKKSVGEEHYVSDGLVVSSQAVQLYAFDTSLSGQAFPITVNSDINSYIYPDAVDINFGSTTENDRNVVIQNNDDGAQTRTAEFNLPGRISTMYITNLGTVSTAATGGENLLPYMTSRNFPRLLSQFSNSGIGLTGVNKIAIILNQLSVPGSVAFTFKNRRFLS